MNNKMIFKLIGMNAFLNIFKIKMWILEYMTPTKAGSHSYSKLDSRPCPTLLTDIQFFVTCQNRIKDLKIYSILIIKKMSCKDAFYYLFFFFVRQVF